MTKEIPINVWERSKKFIFPRDARKNPAIAVMALPYIIPGLVS